MIKGKRVTFQRLDRGAPTHPTLVDPVDDGWDDGPPRDPGWRDIEEVTLIDTRIELTAPGAAAVTVTLERDPAERYWGFGIRSDEVERTHGVVENWVGEGPYQLEEYSLVEAITPDPLVYQLVGLWAVARERRVEPFSISRPDFRRGFRVPDRDSHF